LSGATCRKAPAGSSPTARTNRIGVGTNRANLAIGYLVGGAIMIIGGLVELAFGVNAEGKSLEAVAEPLTKVNLKVWG
jgi:hypothetical protein